MARSLEKNPKNPFKKLIMPHLQLNVNSLFLEKMENQTGLNQMVVT
jgi:hypothetical protein